MTNLIDDDTPGAFFPHPDLPPITVAQLEWCHQRYRERGDTATALVLARLAASKAAIRLSKEMHRRRAGEYVHPAGLVAIWRDPDLRPELQELHRKYLKTRPRGVKWRDVRKGFESAAHYERWERDYIVARVLAMLAERVARSDAGTLAEITRQERNAGLLRWLRKAHYPQHAAVLTPMEQDSRHALNRAWTQAEDELILVVYETLLWELGSLGYRMVAGLVGAVLDREIDWGHVRIVVGKARKKAAENR